MKYIINLRHTPDGIYVSAEVETDEDLPKLSPKAMEEVQLMGAYLVDAAKDWITILPEDKVAYQQRHTLNQTAH